MSIVAAVDGTERTDPVVREAYDLARAFEEPLYVLHVVPEEAFEEHLEEIQSLDEGADYSLSQEESSAARLARDVLEATLESFDAVTVETVGRVGDPTEGILDVARERDARFAVVGGRRRSPVGKAVFGSTTQSVVLESDRPVVTVMYD